MSSLKYLSAYAPNLQQQIADLLEQDRLSGYLLNKYPAVSNVANDAALRNYVVDIKNQYLKKSQPLSKVVFDKKIHVVNNALGLHSFVSRVQGGKLKSKNEIRISTLFKNAPLEFLNMIVVHELAHLKEKEHNKAFYQLCRHMLPDYHQIEFDVRVYLTHLEEKGEVYIGCSSKSKALLSTA
ncbi:M48 family metallopeptidase [Aliiglaciecola litoralis]|uniref:M48 family metallopeptidase n=1 Tax=Aliiglaciecola litoralis TaxID=582857 RepID=UPI0031DADB73